MGKYFEEFKAGDVFVTPPRTFTQDDIQAFADLTGDRNPIHVDPEFAASSIFGQRISHGPMMVGVTFGLLSELDLFDGTVVALKNINWSFDAPIFPGDSVHVRATVEEARASKRSTTRGTVILALQVINQDEIQVQTAGAVVVVATRP